MASQPALLTALFVVRLLFSTLLLCTSLSLFRLKSPSYDALSGVTPVVVAVKTPRRSLILSLLYIVALSYFLDGFALVLHSVLSKTWQGTPRWHWSHSEWSGLEVEAIFGLLSAGLLAAIGSWKESKDVPVWTLKRPRFWTSLATIGTSIEIALLAFTVDFLQKRAYNILAS